MDIQITKIDYADPDCTTDVVHVVKLNDGREIGIWSGQAAYNVYDEYTGKLVVGAKLVGTTDEDDHTVYHFEG